MTDDEVRATDLQRVARHISALRAEDQAEIAKLEAALDCDLPVGTIRVGSGLSAAQDAMHPHDKIKDAEQLRDAARALQRGLDFRASTEGADFWRVISGRLHGMANALTDSARQPPTLIRHNGAELTPAEARALAAELTVLADSATA